MQGGGSPGPEFRNTTLDDSAKTFNRLVVGSIFTTTRFLCDPEDNKDNKAGNSHTNLNIIFNECVTCLACLNDPADIFCI